MPEIQDINQFKNDLIRLGNEPEIREKRGESLPNITVPESESVDDLSALFDDTSDNLDVLNEDELFGGDEPDFDLDTDAEEPDSEVETETVEPVIEDFDSLDDFNLPEGLTEGLSDELSEDSDEEFDAVEDFEDIESIEDVEEAEAVEEAEDVEEAEAEEEFETAGAEEDEFSLPQGLTEGLSDDFEADDPENDDFDMSDFNLEDFDEAPEEDNVAGTEELNELGSSEEASDEFSLDDFKINDTESTEDEEVPDFDDSSITDFDTDDLDLPDVEEPETDMFDTSELDEPGFDSVEFEGDGFGEGDSDEGEFGEAELSDNEFDVSDFEENDTEDSDEFSLDDFSLGEIDGDDLEASEFSLGDLGEEFGVDDEEESDFGQLEGLEVDAGEMGEEFSDAYSDDTYAIPDDEFVDLKKTLGALPRNLKLMIEELIGEKNLSGENLDKLVQALIRGASAKEIGNIVSRITGKKVRIPAQYERRTAEDFEKEKGTFGYVFRKNFVPMFRAAALSALAIGLLLFLGYRFVYTPLHAESLYKKGYEEIPLGNNSQANAYFEEAFSEWRKKNWFYRYAESFAEQKQYILAEEKYEQLLSWYPDERDAVLDYAELEFRTLGKYPEAEKLLNDLLFDQMRDYEARLMLADTYMQWAQEIDPGKYEDARFNYAKLLEQFGSRDELLFRMLRYFIRTDNYTEAMNLYEAFKQNDSLVIEPDIYAELAGYLIDRNQMADVREILMRARSFDEELPEIHYQLARYFDIIDIPYEEEKALSAAIWLFEHMSPLTRTRNGMLIDSYNRYGLVMYQQERYLDAEEYFQKAGMRYDEALAAGQIQPESKYGNIFSNLGDFSYYISGDYNQALKYYEKAELNEYSTPVLKYKKGYIHYSNEDFREALIEFYDTAEGYSSDRGLMYSTANTLFNRNDYFLAEGYYTHLLDSLNKEYSSITYLLIDEIPEHRALLENIMKVSNNLGVTKYRLYERSRNPEKNAEAMVLLTDSVEYYDKLSRNPDSLVEPDTVNLSYLNSKSIFYPVQDYRLQIYQDIPKDLDKISY
ncbi:MAG: tetratricopeptide repeat protein [Spirochaetales bacterium]|uniref:Tetratricopeptide repeat protein n=1 Tax=Candidatus Thalassospirochaeta sargassi TaxID=3119039 RepID=A0AAJ1MK19_9SPIO|nr:tetratricopeptide repeat protein [Spirochaetales bacterium]